MVVELPKNIVYVITSTLLAEGNNGCDDGTITEMLAVLMMETASKPIEDKMFDGHVDSVIKGLFRALETRGSKDAQTACISLVNVSSRPSGLVKVMEFINSDVRPDDRAIISKIVCYINATTPSLASAVIKLLCNVTRNQNNAIKVYKGFTDPLATFKSLLDLFNIQNQMIADNYDYISYLISNLCQLHEVRMTIMDVGILEKLLPFLSHGSALRRGGVITTVKNCSFELEKHEWLLSESLDLLPRLLLPLAGPEPFDDEDNEKLPLDLQYLPEDKTRESDERLRLALIQALTQLCAKRSSREILRAQGTYLILRELHKWEPDMQTKLACENLVDILIKTEDEIGTDNLHEVNVPEDLVEKFQKMDDDYLKT